MENEQKILNYGFEESAILNEMKDQMVFFLNAYASDTVSALGKNNNTIHLYQPRKGAYDDLQKNGTGILAFDLATAQQPESFDTVIVSLSKSRPENLFHLGYAMFLLKPEGNLIVYGSNDLGIQRYEKDLQNAGVETESLHKFKSRIVFAKRPQELDAELLRLWIGQGTTKTIESTELETIAGIFSPDKIDQGSKLLIENLPAELDGMGADLGCGYGYLGYELLKQGKAKNFANFDHDRRAIECARSNLEKVSDDKNIVTFHWQDITAEAVPANSLDWIVMNPPFHQDKKTSADLGIAFIKNAHDALQSGKSLYMVANTHLPYEKPLDEQFKTVEKLAEQDGFKVYKATKA